MSLVGLFNETIHSDWQLEHQGNQWIIREQQSGASNTELKIGGCRSLGFSLDRDVTPFPFIKETSTITSVCDGIIIAEHKNQTVVFIIEMKSKNTGKAYKQLNGAKYLIDYLCQLLSLHSSWNGQYTTKGIISLSPDAERKKKLKRESRKRPFQVHEIRNTSPINLASLI